MRDTVFRALALGLPLLLAQVTASSTGYCIEAEPVRVVSLNAAFLALKQLAVNGCGKDWPAAYWGDVDFGCRVSAMAPGLLRGDYDIIVLNEVFEEQAKAALWFALHNKYPYVVYRLEGDYFGSVRDDSGLMVFSKWPVVDPAFNPRDCMPAVEGTFIKADFNGEWMTEDAKDYIGFRSFADKSGWDSFATKGVGYVRLRSPAGRNYNVFFTHLQADYGWDEREIRHNQLETIRWLQECVAPASLIENHDPSRHSTGRLPLRSSCATPARVVRVLAGWTASMSFSRIRADGVIRSTSTLWGFRNRWICPLDKSSPSCFCSTRRGTPGSFFTSARMRSRIHDSR